MQLFKNIAKFFVLVVTVAASQPVLAEKYSSWELLVGWVCRSEMP